MDHEMNECEVANFHRQTSDVYAYAWMVQGTLFSWITLWHLCHTLNRCKEAYFHATKEYEVANFHGQAADAYV